MGLFDTKLKDVSTLSPEQEQLQKTLGPRLTAMASQGPAAYTYGGMLSAPITDPEQENVNAAARFGAVGGSTLNNLANYDDAGFNTQFQSEIADPTYADFKTNVAPYLEQELPTFSTARANVLARELGNTQNRVMQQRFTAREAAKNRALEATTRGADFYGTQAKTLAVPREIKQAGLDREFTNFYQGNQQYQAGINSMLGFLGIQTKAVINEGSIYDKILAGVNTVANVVSAVQGGNPSQSPDTKQTTISGSNSKEYRASA